MKVASWSAAVVLSMYALPSTDVTNVHPLKSKDSMPSGSAIGNDVLKNILQRRC